MSLAEEPYWTALIIAALFQSVLASGRSESAGPRNCEGRRFDPPPLNQLRTGGGDGCRDEVRREGDGRRARPPWFEPPAGATDADGAPHSLRPCRAAAQRTSSRRPTSPA